MLRPGGVLAIEPYITPVSYVGYRAFHHENIWFGGYQRSADKSDPWEGNLALPNLLFSAICRNGSAIPTCASCTAGSSVCSTFNSPAD